MRPLNLFVTKCSVSLSKEYIDVTVQKYNGSPCTALNSLDTRIILVVIGKQKNVTFGAIGKLPCRLMDIARLR